jgi:hypothetical protein
MRNDVEASEPFEGHGVAAVVQEELSNDDLQRDNRQACSVEWCC